MINSVDCIVYVSPTLHVSSSDEESITFHGKSVEWSSPNLEHYWEFTQPVLGVLEVDDVEGGRWRVDGYVDLHSWR